MDRRTRTSDDYVNPNGSHTAVLSTGSVNYLASDGSFQPIDNHVVADPDSAGDLTNKANGWRVHFGPTPQGVSVDTVSAGSVALAPVGAAGVSPAVSPSGTGVTYADAWPNADLQHDVTGDAVKESVVLKSRQAATSYAFALRAGSKATVLGGGGTAPGLTGAADGSLKFVGSLASAVSLEAPMVTRSDGEPVEAAGAKLTNSNGQAVLSVDPSWLAAQPDSAFPITLDPSILNGTDNSLSFKSDGYSCSNCLLQVGNSRDNNGDYIWRSSLHWDLSPIFGSSIISSAVACYYSSGSQNAYQVNMWHAAANSFNGVDDGGGLLAAGTPGGNGNLTDYGLSDYLQQMANASNNTPWFGLAGVEQPGLYSYQRYTAKLYVVYDHAPTAVAQAGSSPGDKGVVATTTPTLSVPAASDADGDQVFYNFTVTGSGDTAGRVSSGWQPYTSWTVPSGVLADGQSYSWSVSTADNSSAGSAGSRFPVTGPTWSSTLTVNQRLGTSTVTPSDSLAGVSVDLANGNAHIDVAPHSVNTVGGALGIGLSYNSQAAPAVGLLGQYYADNDRQWSFSTAGSPALVRTDPSIDFTWGASGYPTSPPGLPTAQYLVKWTGYITFPTTGSYQLGVHVDDAAKIIVGGQQIYSNWGGAPVDLGWSGSYNETGGAPVPIEIDYYNQVGPGQIHLFVQGAVSQQLVPSTWLSPALATVPAGWTLSAPGGDAGYSHAAITPTAVVLTDPSGTAHTWQANGHGGYTPPAGEDGVLTITAAPSTPANAPAGTPAATVTLKDADGTISTFDAAGNPASVSSATDSLHPAAAVYAYDTTVTPPRLKTVTDPVSGNKIDLYYGADSGNCTPPAGYDTTIPAWFLCSIKYEADNTSTVLGYGHDSAGNELLATVVDPGGEQTQFGYTSGLLSSVRSPLAYDWVAANPSARNAAPVTTDIAYTWVAGPAGGVATNVRPAWNPVTPDSNGKYPAGSIPMATSVTAPSPDGGTSTARPQHTYTYPTGNADETQVHVVGLVTQIDQDVTYDTSGRTLSSKSATGQTTTTAWDAGGQDLPVSSTDAAGRTTTTIYDWAQRATDSYGPAPSACFQTSGFPVSSPPASCGVIPHTHTGFDTASAGNRIQGLEATGWPNVNESGSPDDRVTALPRPSSWTSTLQSKLAGAARSTQLAGDLALAPGTYTLSANVGDPVNDGVRVYLDGQPVIDRWTTERQAILGDNPAGYWRLADPAGSTSAANQVAGQPALVPSSVTFGSAGAGVVDPSTSATTASCFCDLALPSGMISSLATPTIELWFKTTQPGTLFGYQNAAPSASNTPTQFVPALYVGASGVLHGEFWGTGVNINPINTPFAVTDGKWHHAVLTATSTTSQSLYLDGNLVGSVNGQINTAGMTYNQVGVGYQVNWPDGSNGSGANNTPWWGEAASYADVAVYPTSLTSAQVSAHYQAGTATLGGIVGATTARTFTAAAAVAPGSLPAAPPSTPHTIRIDYRNPAATANFSLSATPSGGSAAVIADSSYSPRYGLASRTVTDDAGGIGSETTATTYTGSGLDPAYGLPTDQIVDPGGLKLDTKTGYETPGAGYLRKTASALPSATLGTSAQDTTTTYYGDQETRLNPCGGTTAVNQAGLPKITTSPTPASGTAVATELVYDAAGRVVASRIVSDGSNWTCTTYDARGRVTAVAYPAVNGAPARTVTSNWAVGGDPLTTSVTDPAGTITTRADLLGRTVSYTDAKGVVTATTYDQAGRDTADTTTAPGGGTSTIGTAYLDDGRVSSESLDGLVVAVPSYDSAAQLAGVTYPTGSGNGGNGGSLGGITRDSAGQQTAQLWVLPGSHSIGDGLTLSQSGKVMTDTQSIDGTTNAAWTYGYDAAARLTSATLAAAGARPQVAYTYGFAGSGGCGADAAAGADSARSSSTIKIGTGAPQTTTSCADYASRLTSATGGTPLASATCNSHGDATAMDNRTFTYDSSDRTTGMAISGATSQSLAYTIDSDGRVVRRVASGTGAGSENDTIDYGYTSENDSPDLQLTATKTIAERYVSLPGGVLLTHRYSGTTPDDWALPDLHGDVVATTGPTGAITGSGFLTDPFGGPIDPLTGAGSLTAVPATRTGGATDGWEGQHQRSFEHSGGLDATLMGARTYSPVWGRFLQTDPVPGGSSNPYDYANQDPINRSDIDGNWPHCHWCHKALHITAAVASVASFIPGPVGMIASGVAASAYLANGEYANAASAALGLLPAGQLLGAAYKDTKLVRALGTWQSRLPGIGARSALFRPGSFLNSGRYRIGWSKGQGFMRNFRLGPPAVTTSSRFCTPIQNPIDFNEN